MDQFRIFIPSASRAGRVSTLEALPAWLLPHTYLVVPAAQEALYREAHPAVTVLAPAGVEGIAPTRQWITEHGGARYAIQISDDMAFSKRIEPGNWRLREATPDEVGDMVLLMLEKLASGAVHVGISQRSGNNRCEPTWVEAVRMCDTYGHDTWALIEEGARWDRLPLMEDFDITLQLLRKGYPNFVHYEYAWGQAASNADGGCSDYRDQDMQAGAAESLAALHPGFVKVVTRSSTAWKGMPVRTDVRVSWKKALGADL